jgi:hypothetical protein
MKTFETVTTQKVNSMVCDGCGYGSIHGDGNKIETDLCQQCFADMLRVTEKSHSFIDDNKSSETSLLEI